MDSLPFTRPRFSRDEIAIGDETYEVYHRDIGACLKALYGNPEFARHLAFLPERHYSDADCTMRLFHEMYTGKWWWDVQVCGHVEVHRQRMAHCSPC